MFGLPQQPPSEDELRQHQQQTNQTLLKAAYSAIFLWMSPVVWNFVKKQWK